MLKELIVGAAAITAGLLPSGFASADKDPSYQYEEDEFNQVGLVNLDNTNLLDDVSVPIGVCDNNINIIAIQVEVEETLNGIGVPILSPGASEATGQTPHNCSSSEIEDGGTIQGN